MKTYGQIETGQNFLIRVIAGTSTQIFKFLNSNDFRNTVWIQISDEDIEIKCEQLNIDFLILTEK